MKRSYQQKGFTLVELAIVLTIIGLLIGGILKGQQLMANARVTATIAQIKAIEAATTTFRDTYSAVPGDMTNAFTRLPGCPSAVVCNAAAAGAGNNNVGPGWTLATWQSTPLNGGAPTEAQETTLFWAHLSLGGLLSGVTLEGLTGNVSNWGGSLPAARIGGGFVVGTVGAAAIPARPGGAGVTTLNGMVLLLGNTIGAGPGTAQGGQLLTPGQSAQIDRKMDDGNPATGDVQTVGVANTCYGAAAPWAYVEATGTRDCNLYFSIQG